MKGDRREPCVDKVSKVRKGGALVPARAFTARLTIPTVPSNQRQTETDHGKVPTHTPKKREGGSGARRDQHDGSSTVSVGARGAKSGGV